MPAATPTTPHYHGFSKALKILFSRYCRRASYTHGALRLEQICHNRFWEWYHNAETSGIVDIQLTDGVRYEPTPYLILNEALNRIEIGENDVFADLGCGKGRAMLLAAKRNLKKVVGIEYDNNLLDIARQNIERLGPIQPEVAFCNCLAQEFDYSDITRMYLYNSFGAETLKEVLHAIEGSLEQNPRDLRIAYVNPQHDSLFAEASWLEQIDLWEESMYPAFFIYPPQPKAATFWRVKK